MARPNVLVILADDLGIDLLRSYGQHPGVARTPVLDRLARTGVRFTHAWAHPTCSPTRASALTGLYASRNGIGQFINKTDSVELSTALPTLPALLPPEYRAACIGKWHLGVDDGDWPLHPLQVGFDYHWGPMGNLPNADGARAFFDFEKNIDGHMTRSTTYATTDQVDDALRFIELCGDEPWFLWLAFNAPHRPVHAPPDELHSYQSFKGRDLNASAELAAENADDRPRPSRGQLSPDEAAGDVGSPGDDPATADGAPAADGPPESLAPSLVRAALEALDAELGRLIQTLNHQSPDVLERTYILFMGDNGTQPEAVMAPFLPEQSKGTLFQGGIHVPLLAVGPGVPKGRTSPALVCDTDLFATTLELVGSKRDLSDFDSVSFAGSMFDPERESARRFAYIDVFRPNGPSFPKKVWARVIRDIDPDTGRVSPYKYHVRYADVGAFAAPGAPEVEQLFDLRQDPFEQQNLVRMVNHRRHQAALVRLRGRLDELADGLAIP